MRRNQKPFSYVVSNSVYIFVNIMRSSFNQKRLLSDVDKKKRFLSVKNPEVNVRYVT